MTSIKRPSSSAEAARPYLEGVAKNLAGRIWGPNGPAWGTSLTDVEDLVVSLQQILSERMLRLGLQRQADDEAQRPGEFRAGPSCTGTTEPRDPEPRIVNTRAGEAPWQEPQRYCTRCRRAFFPPVQKPGD